MTWPIALLTVIALLLLAAFSDPIDGLKCYAGIHNTRGVLPDSSECPASAKYCCADNYHGVNNGHYYAERYCSEEETMMDGRTPAACRNITHHITLEKCCCEGDNCNHGDTTVDYVLAGMPLFEPTRCNAVWRPPFWDSSSGRVVGIVYSNEMSNFGYDNGTTIRIKCPPNDAHKRWKADFDPAAVCVNGKWMAASEAINCEWSYVP
ncbi:hypothetical protein AAVH_19942 [Aphelenchoides avenae]|nr:hypothetical protein AAVH_19942 [Aphelenchus avenae]